MPLLGSGGRHGGEAYLPVGSDEDAVPEHGVPSGAAPSSRLTARCLLSSCVALLVGLALLAAVLAPELTVPPSGAEEDRGGGGSGRHAPAVVAAELVDAVERVEAWGGRNVTRRYLVPASYEGRWANVSGQPTYVVEEGGQFSVVYRNRMGAPTLMHVHGQVPPQALDGVPYLSSSPILPGRTRHTSFEARAGTYFVHSHFGPQHGEGLHAPVVVRGRAPRGYPVRGLDRARDVMMYVDEVCPYMPMGRTLDEVLRPGAGLSCDHAAVIDMMKMMHAHEDDPPPCPELRAARHMHIRYARMLANGRGGEAPAREPLEPGERVRVRAVNACGMSNVWLSFGGAASATLVAVDGNWVRPANVSGGMWLGVGNRADVVVEGGAGGVVLLARAEGDEGEGGAAAERVPQAAVLLGDAAAPGPAGDAPGLPDLGLETRLRAWAPVVGPGDDAAQQVRVRLDNHKAERRMNGRTFFVGPGSPESEKPIAVRAGERVRLVMENHSPDSHAMHLHGHVFQVVAVDGVELEGGAVRDTAMVPGGCRSVAVEFVADHPGAWIFHCHMLMHLSLGMATTVSYEC